LHGSNHRIKKTEPESRLCFIKNNVYVGVDVGVSVLVGVGVDVEVAVDVAVGVDVAVAVPQVMV
jgi:hypothetical protein